MAILQVKSPDRATAARAKTLARLIQGNGANKVVLHKSGKEPSSGKVMGAVPSVVRQMEPCKSFPCCEQGYTFVTLSSSLTWSQAVPTAWHGPKTTGHLNISQTQIQPLLHHAGAVHVLVKLVLRGSESASAAGAAHALAAFTTGKNASTHRASVQAANGVTALLT